jgi:hypothetical protein
MRFKASHPVPRVSSPLSRREAKTWEGAQQAFTPDGSLHGELYVWAQIRRKPNATCRFSRMERLMKSTSLTSSENTSRTATPLRRPSFWIRKAALAIRSTW